jgi:hypothetical protein
MIATRVQGDGREQTARDGTLGKTDSRITHWEFLLHQDGIAYVCQVWQSVAYASTSSLDKLDAPALRPGRFLFWHGPRFCQPAGRDAHPRTPTDEQTDPLRPRQAGDVLGTFSHCRPRIGLVGTAIFPGRLLRGSRISRCFPWSPNLASLARWTTRPSWAAASNGGEDRGRRSHRFRPSQRRRKLPAWPRQLR